jgi:hypothetical protein
MTCKANRSNPENDAAAQIRLLPSRIGSPNEEDNIRAKGASSAYLVKKVDTTDLKSVPVRGIGSNPIVSTRQLGGVSCVA